jgi:hypothetical protein
MAYLLNLNTISDERGNLTVLENVLPFEIKRVFYIYNNISNLQRGGHRHHKTILALICLNGTCTVSTDNNYLKKDFILDKPDLCLVLNPEDWHTMHGFSEKAILLVLASEYFDSNDYIRTDYEGKQW